MDKLKSIFIKHAYILPVLLLIPPIFLIHKIPNKDYWKDFFIPALSLGNHLSFFDTLLNRSNEHYILFSQLVYSINLHLGSGDNRTLYVITLLIQAVTALVLRKTLLDAGFFTKRDGISETIKGDTDKNNIPLNILHSKKPFIVKEESERSFLSFIITATLFSPVMAHNFVYSMSGLAWFSANMFFFIVMYFVCKVLMENQRSKQRSINIISIFVFTLAGFFSYSSGLFISIVIMFTMIVNYVFGLRKNGRLTFVYTIFSITLTLFWLTVLYPRPESNPAFELSFFKIIVYLFAFEGNHFADNHILQPLFGLAGIGGLAVLFIVLLYNQQHTRKHILPISIMFSFCLYSLANAGASAIARYGFLGNRYANISIIFWLGVTLLLYFITKKSQIFLPVIARKVPTTTITKATTIIITLSIFLTTMSGIHRFISYLSLCTKEELLDLALEVGVYDLTHTQHFIIGKSTYFDILKMPNKEMHVPFNTKRIPGFSLGQELPHSELKPLGLPIVTFFAIRNISEKKEPYISHRENYFVQADIKDQPKEISRIIVTDTNFKQVGALIPKSLSDLFPFYTKDRENITSYEGYLSLKGESVRGSLFHLIAFGTDKFLIKNVRLNIEHSLKK